MRFTHYKEFDGLEEIALIIDYEYEPEEKQVLYPIDDAYPGCAENAVITAVAFNINGRFTSITSLIAEDLKEELVEAALESYHEGA